MEKLYSQEYLDQCRQQQDPLADAVIAWYFPQRKQELKSVLDMVVDNGFEPGDDMPAAFHQLYQSVFKSPELAQEFLIMKGQKFFSAHSSDILLLLGFLSLPYCYAAAEGSEVLVRSKRIIEEPETRLAETAQFVFDVTAPDAFSVTGKGLASILKVRLMHAAVRYYITVSGTWSEAFAPPINQEDMAGTNLSFSLIPIRGLRKLGKRINANESMAYIEYWNLIGILLGIESGLLPDSTRNAYLLERNIRKRQFKKSEAGVRRTESLLTYFDKAMKGTNMSGIARPFVAYLMGDVISEKVGLDVEKTRQQFFQPFAQFLKLRNLLFEKEDSYLAAYKTFLERQETSGQKVSLQFKA